MSYRTDTYQVGDTVRALEDPDIWHKVIGLVPGQLYIIREIQHPDPDAYKHVGHTQWVLLEGFSDADVYSAAFFEPIR